MFAHCVAVFSNLCFISRVLSIRKECISNKLIWETVVCETVSFMRIFTSVIYVMIAIGIIITIGLFVVVWIRCTFNLSLMILPWSRTLVAVHIVLNEYLIIITISILMFTIYYTNFLMKDLSKFRIDKHRKTFLPTILFGRD